MGAVTLAYEELGAAMYPPLLILHGFLPLVVIGDK